MNEEIKGLWVSKLLEEGRRQGTHRLRSEDGGQCCLDILCEIAVEQGVIAAPEYDNDRGWFYRDVHGGVETQTLPLSVVEWAGLEDDQDNPDVTWIDGDGVQHKHSLAELNDGSLLAEWSADPVSPKTFAEIAEIIRNSEL